MSKIVKVEIQLKGDSKPCKHLALVFDGVTTPKDLIPYRNAALEASKAICSDASMSACLSDEAFWLIQLAEFITTALEDFHETT